MVVATNNGYLAAEKTLEALGIRQHFDLIVSSDVLEQDKPNPSLFGYAAVYFRIGVHNCFVIGDNQDEDAIPAESMGMTAILVSGPADIIANLNQRLANIQTLRAR